MTTTQWTRKIPVRYDADVAVLGGGMAGISAACAAAASGARVILIERFAVTGGNATVGGVASFCGETSGQGEVFDTIIGHLEAFESITPYRPYPRADHRNFNHEILAVILQEMLLSRKVKLLLHTQVVDVLASENGLIKECLIFGRSGLEGVRAKQFIDCTGEAVAVDTAGFPTRKGREEDGLQLPMSLMFFVRHVSEDKKRNEVVPGWFNTIDNSEDLPMTSKWPNGPGGNALKIKIPMFDSTDTESMAQAEIQARRRMMQVLDYYQRVEERPWILDHVSPQIGIREGRRIVGEYTLTVDDVRAGQKFDDGIARGTYYLDAHKPDDDKRTYVLDKEDLQVPPYHIPLRCLIVKDSKNLMAAGRCLSADQLALSSARVMTTCSMMGQAAGITAALAVEKACSPSDLDVQQIQKILVDRGANLDLSTTT